MTVTLPPFERIHPSQPEAEINIVAQIWRRRRIFMAVFAAVMLPALAIIVFWPPVYYASGAVMVGNQEPTSSRASAAWIEKLGDPADLESQLLIVMSHRMLRLALARPGVIGAVQRECSYMGGFRLFQRSDCDKLEPDSDQLLNHVQKNYSVHALGRSRVIAIGYESRLPDVAFVLANALLVTYLEDQRAENASSRESTSAWLLNEANKRNEGVSQAGAPAPANAERAPNAQSMTFYQDLYKRAKDLESERRVLLSSGRLVSLAEVPTLPSFPKRTPLLAAGLTVAFVLGALAALRRDMTDRTVRGTLELEAKAKVPVLAVFPRLGSRAAKAAPSKWLSQPQKITANRADSKAASALYLQLMLERTGRPRQSLLVASSTHREGRGYAAIALARAAAGCGRKVLLVECNFTEPAGHATAEATVGLAGILRGEIEPQEAVIEISPGRLDLIKAGSTEGDPAMVLIDGCLPKLISLAAHYDLAIFDATASGALSNIKILARHMEGVLWCARFGHTQLSDVKAAVDELQRANIDVLGIAVTMADFRELLRFERPRIASLAYCEAE